MIAAANGELMAHVGPMPANMKGAPRNTPDCQDVLMESRGERFFRSAAHGVDRSGAVRP
jgi:hypothetical protein